MRKIRHTVLAAIAATGIMSGCASTQGMSGTTKGALVGAGGGALAGQLIGGDTKATLIGAAVGGLAGAAVGSQQDKVKYYKDKYGRTFYIDANGNAVYVD